MRAELDRLDRMSRGSSPLHRWDARWKLLGTAAYAMAVSMIPIGAWGLMLGAAVMLSFAVGLSTVPPSLLLKRWAALMPVAGALAVMVAMGYSADAEHGRWGVAASLIVRNGLAVLAVLLMAHTTPLAEAVRGLARLGAPRVVIATLQVMVRYLYVLADEFDRMTQARRARTFRGGGLMAWRQGSGLIASLFLRSLERGERVHAAMAARGWDGITRSLDDPAAP